MRHIHAEACGSYRYRMISQDAANVPRPEPWPPSRPPAFQDLASHGKPVQTRNEPQSLGRDAAAWSHALRNPANFRLAMSTLESLEDPKTSYRILQDPTGFHLCHFMAAICPVEAHALDNNRASGTQHGQHLPLHVVHRRLCAWRASSRDHAPKVYKRLRLQNGAQKDELSWPGMAREACMPENYQGLQYIPAHGHETSSWHKLSTWSLP